MTILQTCDNWDTDYNSYNWEPEFMTIFVMWQSRVTVDSIRNSCDVSYRELLNHTIVQVSTQNISVGGKKPRVSKKAHISWTQAPRHLNIPQNTSKMVILYFYKMWSRWSTCEGFTYVLRAWVEQLAAKVGEEAKVEFDIEIWSLLLIYGNEALC